MKNFIEVQEYGGIQRLLNINCILQVLRGAEDLGDKGCRICTTIPETYVDTKQTCKVGMLWLHVTGSYDEIKQMIEEASK